MSAHDDLREAEMDAALSDDPGFYADEIARLREAAGTELQDVQAKLAASRKEAAEVKARITQRELQIAAAAQEQAGDPYDQVIDLAKAELKAGNARTLSRAFDLVRVARPDLWRRYRGEACFQMEALAEEMVKAGKARTVNQALAQVSVDRPDLWRRHVEESPRTQRMKAAAAARAQADEIWGRVVREAEGLVAAGRVPDIHAAIEATWKANPTLREEYLNASGRNWSKRPR